MDEMFRDLSQTGRTSAPRSGSAGNSTRSEGPSYMNDLSRGGSARGSSGSAAGSGSAYSRSYSNGQARSGNQSRSAGQNRTTVSSRSGSSGSSTRSSSGSRSGSSSGASRNSSSYSSPRYSASSGGSRSGSSSGGSHSGASSGGSRSGSSSGGSRSGSSAAAARRKKQQQKRQRSIIAGFVLLLLLLAATVFVIVRSCSGPVDPVTVDPSTATFASDVYINGIPVEGKTVADARAILMPGIEQTVERIAISLTGDLGAENFHESISGADMNITSDIEQVMLTALSGGKGKSYNTTLSIDYDALDRRIAEINTELSFGPTNATFTLTVGDDGKPNLIYQDGKAGVGIDIPATEQLVRDALAGGNYQATLTPQLTQQQPAITVDDLKQQVSLIGSYTTRYRNKGLSEWTEEKRQITLNRAFNVAKATELVNSQVVQPGGVWSFNNTVGDRNEKNGWKLANAITGGERYVTEYGGGVCQVSTTLYNALLRANIEIVYRRKHSIPADYVDRGLDATVNTGSIDFKFKNDTNYPLYVFAYTKVDKSSSRWNELTVLIYGQALPAGVTYEPRAELIEETYPGEPIITYDKKQLVGYEVITVEARNGYKVDVYLDKLVNGEVKESTYLYTDEYSAITQKITMGSMVISTPTPPPTPTPHITPMPSGGNTEDEP